MFLRMREREKESEKKYLVYLNSTYFINNNYKEYRKPNLPETEHVKKENLTLVK